MALVVTGSCSRCGDCCSPPVVLDNPCIKRGQERCMFYEVTDSGCCQIKAGTASATPAQLAWYEANCPGYPNLEAFAAGMVPAQCAFEVVESDDVFD